MRKVRKWAALMLCALLLASIPVTSMALTVNYSRTGSMTVHVKLPDDTVVSGVTFALYRVGDVDNTGGGVGYAPNATYAPSGVTFDYETSAEAQTAAQQLEQYINRNGIPAQASATSGGTGIAIFSSLEVGVYFLRAVSGGPTGLKVSPLIMPIPYFEEDEDGEGGTLAYNVDVYPKTELETTPTPTPTNTPTLPPPPPPPPTTVNLTLRKTWDDNNNGGGTRPASGLVVNIYHKTVSETAYTLFLTVTLPFRNNNNWYLTVEDLPRADGSGMEYEYLAREVVPDGYTVTYEDNGFTMINTYPFTENTPTPVPTLTATPGATTSRAPTNVRYVDGEWVYFDEYGVPLGTLPQTGDDTSWVLLGLAVLLPALLAGAMLLLIYRRKRRSATR